MHLQDNLRKKDLTYAITHNLGMSFKFHLAADNFLSSSDTELACLLQVCLCRDKKSGNNSDQ
jgi:hypothetical protein